MTNFMRHQCSRGGSRSLLTYPVTVTGDNRTMQVFFSPSYTSAAHHFDTTRKAGWIADSLARLPIDDVQLIAPEPVTVGRLEQVHAPECRNRLGTKVRWAPRLALLGCDDEQSARDHAT